MYLDDDNGVPFGFAVRIVQQRLARFDGYGWKLTVDAKTLINSGRERNEEGPVRVFAGKKVRINCLGLRKERVWVGDRQCRCGKERYLETDKALARKGQSLASDGPRSVIGTHRRPGARQYREPRQVTAEGAEGKVIVSKYSHELCGAPRGPRGGREAVSSVRTCQLAMGTVHRSPYPQRRDLGDLNGDRDGNHNSNNRNNVSRLGDLLYMRQTALMFAAQHCFRDNPSTLTLASRGYITRGCVAWRAGGSELGTERSGSSGRGGSRE